MDVIDNTETVEAHKSDETLGLEKEIKDSIRHHTQETLEDLEKVNKRKKDFLETLETGFIRTSVVDTTYGLEQDPTEDAAKEAFKKVQEKVREFLDVTSGDKKEQEENETLVGNYEDIFHRTEELFLNPDNAKERFIELREKLNKHQEALEDRFKKQSEERKKIADTLNAAASDTDRGESFMYNEALRTKNPVMEKWDRTLIHVLNQKFRWIKDDLEGIDLRVNNAQEEVSYSSLLRTKKLINRLEEYVFTIENREKSE